MKDQGFEGSGDLVLIQIPPQPNSNCIKIEPFDFFNNENIDVLNLAFPVVLRKTNDPEQTIALVGDGDTLVYSEGQASASISFLKGIFGADADVADLLPRGTFLSSTDAEVGTSGSPIFSKAGMLIGIARATYNYNQTEYASWHTHGIQLNFHADELRELVPLNKNCVHF